jgi:hypothetical protein
MGMLSWLFGFDDYPRRAPRKTYGPNPEAVAIIAEVRQLLKDHKVTDGLGEDYPILANRYMVSMMEPHNCDDTYRVMYEGERGGWRSHIAIREFAESANDGDWFDKSDYIREDAVTVYAEDFKDVGDMFDLKDEIMKAGMLGEMHAEIKKMEYFQKRKKSKSA